VHVASTTAELVKLAVIDFTTLWLSVPEEPEPFIVSNGPICLNCSEFLTLYSAKAITVLLRTV